MIDGKYIRVVGVDVENFLLRSSDFIEQAPSKIEDFYSGKSLDGSVFSELNTLKVEQRETLAALLSNRGALDQSFDWDVFEAVELVGMTLDTLKILHKYMRASESDAKYRKTRVNYIMSQSQTVESVARDVAMMSSPEDTWVAIAIDSDLREEDYDVAGGSVAKYQADKRPSGFALNAVFGSTYGDEMYGRDVDREIMFADDDLKVLSPLDTFKQAVTISLSLKKGDNPEFPGDGISSKLIGSSVAALAYPAIFRQIYDVVATDDTIASIYAMDVQRDVDGTFVTFSVVSRKGELFNEQIKV